MKKEDWFSTWFDTRYYHILYQHRSFDEAEKFISNLLNYFDPKRDSRILDLACGKGRHSFFIAQGDYNVTGVDLSPESIQWAKQHYALPNLSFDVHDMRKVYQSGGFDYIFNFFTSFGYFENNSENQEVVQSMSHSLNPNGTLVIDFMNAKKTLEHLKKEEQIELDGIVFHITRSYKEEFIIKTISFEDNGQQHEYYERVQALSLVDFKTLFETAKLRLVDCFGDYDLRSFDEDNSNRLIMVLKKNA